MKFKVNINKVNVCIRSVLEDNDTLRDGRFFPHFKCFLYIINIAIYANEKLTLHKKKVTNIIVPQYEQLFQLHEKYQSIHKIRVMKRVMNKKNEDSTKDRTKIAIGK